MRLGKAVNASAAWHRSSDRANSVVGFCQFRQSVTEHVLIGGRASGRFRFLASDHIEFGHAVIFVRAFLGGGIALALGRHDMDQNRALLAIADILQNRDQMVKIVAIDWADIIEAELFKKCPASDHAARVTFGFIDRLVDAA